MNCRQCQTPSAPHELVDHEGQGKSATGLCIKCVKEQRDRLHHATLQTSSKIAKNHDEAFAIQNIPPYPRAWIQWKGTDACLDVHCSCGQMSHVDGEFLYYIQCRHCSKIFFLNGHIEMIEMSQPPPHSRITLTD